MNGSAFFSSRVAVYSSRILVLVCVLFSLGRMAYVSYLQLFVPYDLYFETHHLGSIQALQAGLSLYSPSTYGDVPFILTMYNPLFFYVVANLPTMPTNPFLAGRVVSLVMVLSLPLLLVFVRSLRHWSLLGLLVAWLFLIHQPVQYAAFLRLDSMGVFWSLLAIVLLARFCSIFDASADTSPVLASSDGADTSSSVQGDAALHMSPLARVFWLLLLVLTCFLAFLTKQSFLSASATCFVYLLLYRRRDWRIFSLLGLVVFGGFALFASLVWGKAYWFIAYTAISRTQLLFSIFWAQWKIMLLQPAFVLLMLGLFASYAWGWRQQRGLFWKSSPYPLYCLFVLLALVLSCGKEGAGHNYFLELLPAAMCVFLVLFDRLVLPAHRHAVVFVLAVCLGLSVLYEGLCVELHHVAFSVPQKEKYYRKVYASAAREIKAVHPAGGKILSLNAHSIVFKVQNPGYLNDTHAYWLMWRDRILDLKPLLRAIREKRFSLILLQTKTRAFIPNFMPRMNGAFPVAPVMTCLRKHYRLKHRGMFLYYTPK